MATKYGNILGVKWLEAPRDGGKGGVAVITFDMAGTAYTGGTDTVQLGGGGTDARASTTATLATILQNRRRDGKTITLGQAMHVAAGVQTAATNGPDIFAQSGSVSAGNVTLNLFNALTSGTAVTTTTAAWEQPMMIAVSYTAT